MQMDQDERRIRTLKLRSSDGASLLQARHRLEEAFRTASLPGLPPNAQLLIRRLDLGSIRVDQSPVLLANKITEMMRHLAATAVCVDQQSAVNANVVWFSDPLQPYTVLLLKLLDGNGVHEWYWQTLFPHQPLALDSATVERVLMYAARTPLKGLAVARLLQAALEPRRLALLFSLVTAELARRLLHEQGLTPVAVSMKAAFQSVADSKPGPASHVQMLAAPKVTLPWRQALQQAAQCWGEADVRTLWFAWHALIFHHPAYLERKDVLQRMVVGDWLESWSLENGGSVADGIRRGASDQSAAVLKSKKPSLPETDPSPVQPAISTDRDCAAGEQEASSAAVVPQTVLPAAPERVDPSFNAVAEQLRDNSSMDATLNATLNTGEVEPQGADMVARVVVPFSQHAGFAFVIPLLQRLGMAELLARNESLVALDFPRQLLWALAHRFGMAENDAARQLFEGFEPCADITVEQFHAPDIWQQLVTRGSDRACKAPIQLHQLIKTMQLLMALYLRRHSGLSWRGLMQRPGRVVLTATHWDVIFDINQIDLRLRRIALDSDPGWVVWLGRVVQFHYDNEG